MKRSAWTGVATRDFTDVDVAALDATLAQRLEWAKNRIDLPAGRYETLLPPTAVADLMIYLYWTAGARDALDGRTVFSKPGGGTRVGETLSELPMPAVQRPRRTAASSARRSWWRTPPAGRARCSTTACRWRATDWIADGRLANLLQTRHSAELTGLPVTPAIDNLIMTGPEGGRSLEEMIASTERGLLLTCLWYIREVDPQTLLLTGLTRDGVYLVENGEVVGEVNNFRFNESPVDLLGRLTEVGAARADPAARVERLLHPHGDARRSGCPTSTCRRSARPARTGPGLAPCGRRRLRAKRLSRIAHRTGNGPDLRRSPTDVRLHLRASVAVVTHLSSGPVRVIAIRPWPLALSRWPSDHRFETWHSNGRTRHR